jgi:metal-responsive CopG/Arc/MetJ family transcriptional regulator
VILLGELRFRKKIGTTLRNDLADDLQKLSDEIKIPRSKLIDEAIEDLLKKYDKLRRVLKT